MKTFAEISYLLAVAVLLPVASSCSDDVQEEEVPVGNNRMSVNISCSDMTRATEAGSNAFNENLLSTLDIFYYRTASDDDCFEHDRVTQLSKQGSATYTKYLEILTKEKFFGTGNSGSCYVYVIANGPQTDIDSLLNDNIASVANLKKIVLFSPDLGNSEVQSDMGTKLVRQETFVMDGGAMMTYSNGSATVNVKLARSLSKIQLYVHFPDSVIVDGKTYKPSIISVNSTDKKAWGKAVFNNGLKRGYVNDSTDRHYTPSDDDYYPASGLSYDAKARYIRSDTLSIIRTSNDKKYYTHSPFYTYPMRWETFRSNLSTRPTTLMLVVDWYTYDDSDGMSAKTTFYTIDVNSSQADGEEYKFKRNTFYKLYVEVNTIGSDSSTEPIEIAGECEILDWNHVNQETSIENLRYLIVEQNDYVLDNEETLYIPYSTSHECEISEITATRCDLTGNIVDTLNLTKGKTISVNGNVYSITDGWDFLDPKREFSIEIDDDNLIFSHSLENRESVEDTLFDYVPFEVTFTVRHKDDYSYSETIHIKQHPELSIEAQTNSDFESDPVSSEDNEYEGYVFVNGYNHPLGEGYGYLGSGQGGENSLSDSEEPDAIFPRGLFKTDSGVYYTYYSNYFQNSGSVNEAFLGRKTGIISTSTVENQNPNRYLIRAAVASGESQYIIGNPLSDNVDNIPLVLESSVEPRITTIGAPTLSAGEHTWSKDARYLQADGSISDDTRMLTYYRPGRPSDESPSSTNVVAPRFMVASSYGVTTSLLRDNALRRCASYQEEGYPAGRWRLPTTAEVMFCIQLTRNGMIPRLFGTNGTNVVAIFRNSAYYTTTGYVISNWDTGEEVISSGEGDIPDTEHLFYKWVRCVYDVWYWGEDMPLEPETFTNGDGTEVTGYRFTWGDMAE